MSTLVAKTEKCLGRDTTRTSTLLLGFPGPILYFSLSCSLALIYLVVGTYLTLPGDVLDELEECEFIGISLELSRQEMH